MSTPAEVHLPMRPAHGSVSFIRGAIELIDDSDCQIKDCLCRHMDHHDAWQSGCPTTDLPPASVWTPGGAP